MRKLKLRYVASLARVTRQEKKDSGPGRKHHGWNLAGFQEDLGVPGSWRAGPQAGEFRSPDHQGAQENRAELRWMPEGGAPGSGLCP